MHIKTNQIFIFLAIVCFVLLTRNLFVLKFVQPIGYVIDIYSMFPLSFYLGLMFCYLVATFLVLNGKKTLGALILCFNHLEILLIPYMLGYYSMGRADEMTYIGEYLQISNSGHISGWNIYPASQIIGAGISLISEIEAHSTSFIIPIVFSFIFIAGIYLFSKELFPDSCINSLALCSSFILYLSMYNFQNTPHALFYAYMALYLYQFYRYFAECANISNSILFIIMTLLIPFTHPFIVFFVFIFYFAHMLPKIIPIVNLDVLRIPKINRSSFLILVTSFLLWFINHVNYKNRFRASYIGYISKVTETVSTETTKQLTKVHLGISDYAQLLSFFYGRYAFPSLIIFISFIGIYFNRQIIKKECFRNYPYLVLLYVVFFIMQIILLFNPIIAHQPDRIISLNFVVYAQVPLFACALYLIFLQQSKSHRRIILVCGLLLLVWSFSLFGSLDSPNVYRANEALTQNEVSGMNWFYEVGDESTIMTVVAQIERFHYLSGDFKTRDRMKHPSNHFGYSNNSSNYADLNLDEIEKIYIIIFTMDELLYQELPIHKRIGRYTKDDFERFRNDTSVNKIYDNLNIEIFKSG